MAKWKIVVPVVLIVAAVMVVLFLTLFNASKIKLFEERNLELMGYKAQVYSYYTEEKLNYDDLKSEIEKIFEKKKKESPEENIFIYVFDEKKGVNEINIFTQPEIMAAVIPDENFEFVGDTLDSQQLVSNTASKLKCITDFQSISMAVQMYSFENTVDENFELQMLDGEYLDINELELKGNYRIEKHTGEYYAVSKTKLNFSDEEKEENGIEMIDGYPAKNLEL